MEAYLDAEFRAAGLGFCDRNWELLKSPAMPLVQSLFFEPPSSGLNPSLDRSYGLLADSMSPRIDTPVLRGTLSRKVCSKKGSRPLGKRGLDPGGLLDPCFCNRPQFPEGGRPKTPIGVLEPGGSHLPRKTQDPNSR